jgi:crossover junction endodeoxyribonuclease RusA
MTGSSDIGHPSFTLADGAWLLPDLPAVTRIQEAGGEDADFRLVREHADLPVIARFTIEGEPACKARARFTNYGSKVRTYTPERTRTAELKVAASFQETAGDYSPDADTTYGIMALFFPGTRQRRDVDNMMKLLLDALNKIAWEDDNQVVELSARKSLVLPEEARTEVVIYKVGKVQYFTVSCLHCKKDFATFPSWSGARKLKKYCSPECSYTARRKISERICAACGNTYQREDRPQSKYCSNECGRKFMGPH